MGKYMITQKEFLRRCYISGLIPLEPYKNSQTSMLFECRHCENKTHFQAKFVEISRGHTQSCGCLHLRKISDNLLYFRFNRLRVISKTNNRCGSATIWECLCDCGNTTYVDTHSLKDGRTKSCGCFQVDYMKSLRGSNSPHWNLNLTDEYRIDRRKILGYDDLMTNVYVRDNYTCQVCYRRNCKISGHHLYCWGNYPQYRFNKDYIITLCESETKRNIKGCHNLFHSKYGKINNTPEQFQEFLSLQQKLMEKR